MVSYDAPVSDEESTETTEDDPNVWIEEERQRRERRVEVIYDPEKAIHTFPRCVIMGGPGAEKTTLLRHLAIMAAQRSIAGMPSLLPVYVELQSFVDRRMKRWETLSERGWMMRSPFGWSAQLPTSRVNGRP